MYAIIGATPDRIDEVCKKTSAETWKFVGAVNYNSDSQTVISGEEEAVEKAAAILSEEGSKAIKLEVAGAFHTPLMGAAADELRLYLQGKSFGTPDFPLYSTYTGKLFSDKDINNLPEYLYNQMISPVRFTDTIRAIKNDHPDVTFFEAGKTLTNLVRKIKV
jgi:[acyl-carrier-protein] S-malonyltransferase